MISSDETCLLDQEGLDSVAAVTARKKKTWGGRRKGAGRKAVLKEPRSVTFDLEEPDFDALKETSEKDGISVAQAARKAITAYLRRRGKA